MQIFQPIKQSNHKSFKFFVIPNPDILWLKLAIGKGLEWFWNGDLTTDMWNSWKGAQLDSGHWIYKLCGYSSSLGSLWSTRTKMEMTTMTAIHTVEDSLNDPSSPAFHLPDQVWSTRPSEYFPGLRAFQNWVVGAWYHCSVSQRKRGNKPKTNCCILLSAFCQFGWDRWSTKGISVWPDKWIGV